MPGDVLNALHKALANFSLFLVSTLCALLVGEAAARLLLRDSIVLFPRFFTEAHYDGVTLRKLIPNSTFWHTSIDGRWQFRINHQGFRDDENYVYAKPEGRRRVLVLGDSHTQGYEVRQEATFSKVLEQRFRARGMDVQVLNTGVSGFGTAEQLLFLEREGKKYSPDAVVVAFFENDFEDSAKSGLFELKDGSLLLRKTHYAPGATAIRVMNAFPGAEWLSQNSYLFSYLVNAVWLAAKQILTASAKQQLENEYAIRTTEVDTYQQELVAALLARMKSTAQAIGARFIVIEIPAADLTEEHVWLPSFPHDFSPVLSANSDVFVPASSYLAEAPRGSVHVPHGHRHISEWTHAKVAAALEQALGTLDARFRTVDYYLDSRK